MRSFGRSPKTVLKRSLFQFTVALIVLIVPNFIFARGQRLTTDNQATDYTTRIREEISLENHLARANPKKRRATQRPALGGSAMLAQSKPGVTVTDIGPDLGVSFALEGFLVHPQDPRQILVNSQNGVFKSIDDGRSWRRVNLITEDGQLDHAVSLRQDPSNPSVVYAVTDLFRARLYRSSDFGDTWVALFDLHFSLFVDCAVHQTSPNVIFVLQDTGDDGALIKSTDGGASFEHQSGNGLPEPLLDEGPEKNPLFTSMATTPADPNLVYVVNTSDLMDVADPGGVYKSTDGGGSFTRLDSAPATPRQVFPHPTQSSTIFLQAEQQGTLTGIYRSTDGGESFAEATAGLPAGKFNFFVVFDPRNPSFVYVAGEGGLFHSTDGGFGFQALGLKRDQIGEGATTLSIDAANSNVIYVNTDQGNFKSVNGGVSFLAINDGWRGSVVTHLTFDNHSEPSLYVSTAFGNGVLKTQSRGGRYEQIAEELAPGFRRVSGLSVAATDRNFIVALTASRGIFRSTDGGQSWTAASINPGQTRFNLADVAIDPNNSNNVYVACADSPLPNLGSNPGFYRSTDGGQTFRRSFAGSSPAASAFRALAVDPSNPNVIYTGSRITGFGGLLKSTNGGLSFTSTSLGTRSRLFRVAVDPLNPQNVYLVGEFRQDFFSPTHSVLRSTDGGATFTAADSGLGFVSFLVIDPVNPLRLFAWGSDGLFRTDDGATSWTLLEGGEALRRFGLGFSMAINPKNPNLLYLGGASVLEIEINH